MKQRILMALLISSLMGSAAAEATMAKKRSVAKAMAEKPAEIAVVPTIKILIEQDVTEALLEVKGSYKVYDPLDGRLLVRGLLAKSFFAQPLPTGLKWGEEFPGVYQLSLVPSSHSALSINGIPYQGTVLVYQIGPRLSVVNEVNIEDYVKMQLSKEVDPAYSLEVIAAMAIVARTDAYYQRMIGQDAFWQLSAAEVGFDGIDPSKFNPEVARAVDETHNLILQSNEDYATKGLFPATWTEHCGGKTAAYHVIHRCDVVGPKVGVENAIAAQDRKQSSWVFNTNKDYLASLVDMPKVTKVSLYTDSQSDKVYHLRFFNGSESKDVDFFTFQKLVGSEQLPSNDFTVTLLNDHVTFVGYGKGFGVGLCLYSAEKLAERGANAQQILGKFFPDTQLALMPSLKLQTASLQKIQNLKTITMADE